MRCPSRMASEENYQDDHEHQDATSLLSDIRTTVRSIDKKVEEILDDLQEHFEDVRSSTDDTWDYRDYYDNANNHY